MGLARSEAEIRDWCIDYLGRTLEGVEQPISPEMSFARLGLDSGNSVHFMVELEEWLGRELNPEAIFEHPTIAELARYLAEEGQAQTGRA
jgi:acyl carrier protein